MDVREKRTALEAAGWKFERYSRTRGKWVRISGNTSRRLHRAIEDAWRQHRFAPIPQTTTFQVCYNYAMDVIINKMLDDDKEK